MQQKIVFIGGPGTGKSSVLKYLKRRGYKCMPEISREVTREAQEKGIEQLFLTDPLLFSRKLLEGREKQFLDAEKSDKKTVFFDRGIPSVYAYLQYFNTEAPDIFLEKSKAYKYTKVFQFLPWKAIYKSDNERYETFEQAEKISEFLNKTYTDLGYEIINVPFDSVKNRCFFILDHI
ncbi:ATP-binding protein [uncultured Tenacibaculum sp.]|uniref:ATP-binding protein n=1 Tax=uncultured Tenacibaculum sp. TaxID=174713 RepID=UPI00260A32E3|nr:ATP-binding protein [uncultured Tenacibaculum sp.]